VYQLRQAAHSRVGTRDVSAECWLYNASMVSYISQRICQQQLVRPASAAAAATAAAAAAAAPKRYRRQFDGRPKRASSCFVVVVDVVALLCFIPIDENWSQLATFSAITAAAANVNNDSMCRCYHPCRLIYRYFSK